MKKQIFITSILFLICLSCASNKQQVFGYKLKEKESKNSLWERGNPEVENYMRTSIISRGNKDSIFIYREFDDLDHEYIGLGNEIFSLHNGYIYINDQKLTVATIIFSLNYDDARDMAAINRKGTVTSVDRMLSYSIPNDDISDSTDNLIQSIYYIRMDSLLRYRGIYVRCDERGYIDKITYDIFDDTDKAVVDTFPKAGYGYWKSYYLVKLPQPSYDTNNEPYYLSAIIKEEGEFRKNRKYGLWKYYDAEGNLQDTKTYKLSDRAPVLFPFTIFDKRKKVWAVIKQ